MVFQIDIETMDTEINVEEIDFGVMCRACALRFDLSVLRDITPAIRDAFLSCTGIEVDLLSEDMPTHICGTCWSRADNASQFKLQCQQSDEKLRALLAVKRARLASSTPSNVDDDEPAEEFVGASGSPDLSEQLDMKLHPLPSAKRDLMASSTPFHVDDDEMAQFGCCSIRSPHPLQHSDGKLASLLSAKRQRLVSSTPRHDGDDDLPEEFGDYSSRLPNLTLLELEIPLSPTECDPRIAEVLNQDGDVSQNLYEASSMTNFLNEILEEDNNPECKEADKEKQDHIINPDSVLSFLNDEESDLKCSENILSESFSLIDNLSTSINKEPNAIPELNEVNNDIANENFNIAIPIKAFENNNNVESEFCMFDIDNIHGQNVRTQPVNCEECKDTRRLVIVVTDYVKLAMPEKVVLNELKDLGYARCRYCYKRFADVKNIYRHLLMNHKIECLNHTNGFDCSKALHPELWINERLVLNKRTNGKKGFVRCKICSRQYLSAESLYLHVSRQHSEKEMIARMIVNSVNDWTKKNCKDYYVCDYCGKEYKNRKLFLIHIKNHQKRNNVYMCMDCGEGFKKRSSYLQHKKLHTIRVPNSIQETISIDESLAKPFLCNICGKSLSNQWNLNAHMKRHTSSTSLVCHICNKGIKMARDFNRHVKAHSKSTHSHKCKICDKTFPRSDYLMKHFRRKHCDDRVYACVECGKRFKYMICLKNHLKKAHNTGTKDSGGQVDGHIMQKTEVNTVLNEIEQVKGNNSLIRSSGRTRYYYV